MKDIQHYKDLIAVEHGYEDWEEALTDYKTGVLYRNAFIELENEWAKRYAEDMCKVQRELCAEDLPANTPELTIHCVLDTRLATDN